MEAHLKLLRAEYGKLQSRHEDLERRYGLLAAQTGVNGANDGSGDSFAARILKAVAGLYDNPSYRSAVRFNTSTN